MKKLLKRNFKKLMSVILAFCICFSGAATVYAGGDPAPGDDIPYFIVMCKQSHAVKLDSLDKEECIRRCDENFKKILLVLKANARGSTCMIIDFYSYEYIFLAIELVCVVYSAQKIDLAKSMLNALKEFKDCSIILRELFASTNELWVRKPLYRLRDGGVSEVIRITSPQL